MSDLMREEFEAAYKQETERQGKAFDRSVLTRQASGDYVIGLVQAAWWAWQASRECLVIELPKHRVSECGSPGMVPDDDGDFFYYDEVISSIHASGVKTK